MKPTPKKTFLHPGVIQNVAHDFKCGLSIRDCARKWKVQLSTVERIIREQLK